MFNQKPLDGFEFAASSTTGGFAGVSLGISWGSTLVSLDTVLWGFFGSSSLGLGGGG